MPRQGAGEESYWQHFNLNQDASLPSHALETELEQILHARSINVCCNQKPHPQSSKSFKIRGYQCFRSDRTDRRIVGIFKLVRNNIYACETAFIWNVLKEAIKVNGDAVELLILTCYRPND